MIFACSHIQTQSYSESREWSMTSLHAKSAPTSIEQRQENENGLIMIIIIIIDFTGNADKKSTT